MINILFPREKKRIIKEISDKIKSKCNNFKIQHIDKEKVYMYVFLEDGTPLYITAMMADIAGSMTICNDMSF